jgi:hypothetical protein
MLYSQGFCNYVTSFLLDCQFVVSFSVLLWLARIGGRSGRILLGELLGRCRRVSGRRVDTGLLGLLGERLHRVLLDGVCDKKIEI